MDEPLLIRAFDWKYYNNGKTDNNSNDIHCWGLNRENKPCLLRILNYQPTLYFKLPFSTQNGKIIRWNEEHAEEIYNVLRTIAKQDRKKGPVDSLLVMKKCFYYYGPEKPMVQLKFTNRSSMNYCVGLLTQGIYLKKYNLQVAGECIGNDINPLLGFTCEQGIKHANWLQVANYIIINDTFKIAKDHILEYCTDYCNVFPCPEEYCKNWQVYPTLISFDLETYSPDHKRFPDADLIECKITVNSCLVKKYDMDKQAYVETQYVFLLGNVDKSVIEKDDVVLYCYDASNPLTELQKIYDFCSLLESIDPDVIMGYNIYNFDYPYLDSRIGRWPDMKWPNISRLKDYDCKIVDSGWKSKAYSNVTSSILDIEGRISIDLMPLIMREHKLPKYSLNYVSGHFLDDHKDDMSAAQMFASYENIRDHPDDLAARQQWGLVIKYAIQDTALVLRLFDYLEVWNYLSESADITHVTIMDTFMRGQQIRTFSLIYWYCCQYNYVIDKRSINEGGYKGGYVRDPVVGVHDKVIVLDFASLYPNVMVSNNFCPTRLIYEHHYEDIDPACCNIIDFEQEEDANAALNKEIEAYNADEMNIDKKEKLKEDMIVKKYHYRFYQTGNDEDIGIVPRLLRELLAWRKEVKNLMKTAKGNYKKLLDARQLAIKVTCNSVYGFFGTSGNGMRSCLEVARSVTARAREYIHRSFDYLVNTYQATILAADTDSAMFTIPYIKERSECNKWGELLAIEMSYGVKKGDIGPFGVAYQEDRPAIFPKGIEFTHEKDMIVCYLCKKHYFAWFIKPDGTIKKAKDGSNELLAKGIPLVRRDTTPIVAELYSKLVEIILSGGSILQALAVTMQHMCDIYQNKFDYTHFTTITKLGENYKNPNHPMELFRKFLHSVGKSAKPGDRLEYIIVVNPYATHKGHKMVLAEQYLDSLKTANSYQIDYDHYIEKSLNNPINQLFKYGFIKEMSFLRPYIQYKIGRWVNTRSLDDIIEILLAARTHNLSYNDIYHHVHIIHVQIFPK